MPRNAPRIPQAPGAPAGNYPSTPSQAVTTPPSDAYGETVEREATQEAAPLPDEQSRWKAQLGASEAMAFPEGGGLNAPSVRPHEPVTAGSPTGPGPGQEALTPMLRSPVAHILDVLARDTNDPMIAQLAQAAQNDQI